MSTEWSTTSFLNVQENHYIVSIHIKTEFLIQNIIETHAGRWIKFYRRKMKYWLWNIAISLIHNFSKSESVGRQTTFIFCAQVAKICDAKESEKKTNRNELLEFQVQFHIRIMTDADNELMRCSLVNWTFWCLPRSIF